MKEVEQLAVFKRSLYTILSRNEGLSNHDKAHPFGGIHRDLQSLTRHASTYYDHLKYDNVTLSAGLDKHRHYKNMSNHPESAIARNTLPKDIDLIIFRTKTIDEIVEQLKNLFHLTKIQKTQLTSYIPMVHESKFEVTRVSCSYNYGGSVTAATFLLQLDFVNIFEPQHLFQFLTQIPFSTDRTMIELLPPRCQPTVKRIEFLPFEEVFRGANNNDFRHFNNLMRRKCIMLYTPMCAEVTDLQRSEYNRLIFKRIISKMANGWIFPNLQFALQKSARIQQLAVPDRVYNVLNNETVLFSDGCTMPAWEVEASIGSFITNTHGRTYHLHGGESTHTVINIPLAFEMRHIFETNHEENDRDIQTEEEPTYIDQLKCPRDPA